MDELMKRFAASVVSRGPIKREPSGRKSVVKCCDERKIDHDSKEKAKADTLIAQPRPLNTRLSLGKLG